MTYLFCVIVGFVAGWTLRGSARQANPFNALRDWWSKSDGKA